MRTRLLLDPAAEPGGGGSTTPAPAPAPATTQPPAQPPPPAAAASAPPPSPVATVPISELQQYLRDQRELNELRVRVQQEKDAAEQARIAEIAKREGAEHALAEQKKLHDAKLRESVQRYESLRTSLHAERMKTVVSEALAGTVFMNADAAIQARTLLEMDLETATDAEGGIVVRQKGTGRPAADYIKDVITTPKYDHFIRATTRGGGGAPAATAAPSAPGPVPGTVQPSNPGEEAFALWWQQQQAAHQKGYAAIGLTLPVQGTRQNLPH